MVEIPLQPLPSQELQVLLDSQPCTITLRWFGSEPSGAARLYAGLRVGNDMVFDGAVCLNGQIVNQSPSHLFSGFLVFLDTQGREAPRWDGLGGRWALLYLSDGELDRESLSGSALLDALRTAMEE